LHEIGAADGFEFQPQLPPERQSIVAVLDLQCKKITLDHRVISLTSSACLLELVVRVQVNLLPDHAAGADLVEHLDYRLCASHAETKKKKAKAGERGTRPSRRSLLMFETGTSREVIQLQNTAIGVNNSDSVRETVNIINEIASENGSAVGTSLLATAGEVEYLAEALLLLFGELVEARVSREQLRAEQQILPRVALPRR
jgi:hypothetical protein